MRPPKWISPLFVVAALYDGVLGLVFLAAPNYLFDLCDVTRPNHPGYVQFPAALLIVFALMFAAVAKDPVGNRQLMIYGILLKLAYCALTSWYWVTTPSQSIPKPLPDMWKPFLAIDLVMGLLFAWAYLAVRAPVGGQKGPQADHHVPG